MEKPKSRLAEALETLGYKDYRSYLNSKHWKKFRARILRRDKVCLCCGGTPTEVHHKRYRRLGREAKDDAVSLCRDCHEKIHLTHRSTKIKLGDFAGAASVIRKANGYVDPCPPAPAEKKETKKEPRKRSEWEPKKVGKRKIKAMDMEPARWTYIEPLAVIPRSPVEDLPLFAMRFIIAASLKGGKTLDRIQLDMRCSREHLDRVAYWLSSRSLAPVTPARPPETARPAKGRVKGLRRFLD